MKHTFVKRVTLADKKSMEAAVLGSMGFYYRTIAARTGLSIGQVGRRLRMFGVRVKSYRDGSSPVAHRVVEAARGYATNHVRDHAPKSLKG